MKLSYYIDFYKSSYLVSDISTLQVNCPKQFSLSICSSVDEAKIKMLDAYLDKEVTQLSFYGVEGDSTMVVEIAE